MPLSFGSPRVLQAMQAAMERGSSPRRNAAQANRARKAASAQGIARAMVGQAGGEHKHFDGIEIERFRGMCHVELQSLKCTMPALCAQACGLGLGYPTGLPDPVMLPVHNAPRSLASGFAAVLAGHGCMEWHGGGPGCDAVYICQWPFDANIQKSMLDGVIQRYEKPFTACLSPARHHDPVRRGIDDTGLCDRRRGRYWPPRR